MIWGLKFIPKGSNKILKQFGEYEGIKEIIVMENGVCVKDSLDNGEVNDQDRINFFKSYLENVLKAKTKECQ